MLGAQRRSQQKKIRLRKNILYTKKKRLFVQSYENTAQIKEYNKKYF